ncbi:hypothetical protein MYXO_00128 [Myxococcaceae bacterium]|jgi:hypothetical protein|nr:hypothetical protein MYXO_00128 [Myxococcaceae bacterium]
MFRSSLAVLMLAASTAAAYPGGTPDYQTDVAPFCASCHASVDVSSLAGAPPDRATRELAANKHLAPLRSGAPNTPYATMAETDRSLLADLVEKLDRESTVEIAAPAKVAPGQEFDVTVTVKGGGGPVAGVGLVDADQRWYARSAPSAGWRVVAAPVIRGPGAKLQTKWLEKRPEALGRNLSYVNIEGISSDPANDSYPSAEVVFRLEAPAVGGKYPIAAVFYYGTELASPLGTKVDPKDPQQRKSPVGGFGGASGRVRFTPVESIEVGL